MKKLLLISPIGIIFISGCKKEDEKPLCEEHNYGTLKINNKRDWTYKLYIDNEYRRNIEPMELYETNLPAGHHYIKLTTGLDYYYYKTVNIRQCNEVTITHG